MLKGLGDRLRELRKQRQLTLIELAKVSKIHASTLSRMERGRMIGTLEAHVRLCKALRITLAELYVGLADATSKVSVRTARDHSDICRHNDKVVQRFLTTDFLQKRLLPSLLEMAPGGKTPLEQHQADVEKFCYVINGRVRYSVGQDVHDLKAGDALYFEGHQPSHLENTGTNSAKLLCVTVPSVL
ncbi:MAG: helix-turn-helix transcriptional regulator [Candidatus Omnitrophica bacterium]|nr:helix-turn-helix transcriptional regulator [Candidatus Omnitrophota bacterium]